MPDCPNARAREIEHQTRLARIRHFIQLTNQKDTPDIERTAKWVIWKMNSVALFGAYPFEYDAAEPAWDFTIDHLGDRRNRNFLASVRAKHPIDAAIDIAHDLHTTAPLQDFMLQERDVPEAFLIDLFINITRVHDIARLGKITKEEEE